MANRTWLCVVILSALAAVACDNETPTDAGGVDGSVVDSGESDAAPPTPDTGPPAPDGGPPDAGPPSDSGTDDAGTDDAGADAGTSDAGPDAGADAGPDSGADAGPDSGPDAGPDSGPDAGPDSGPDAGPDSGPDAGPPPACADFDLGMNVSLDALSGTTAGAAHVSTGSCSTGTAGEVTASWTAPSAGSFTFDTLGSSYDTALYLLRGPACDGAELACNDDAGSFVYYPRRSRIRRDFTAGEQIIVVIDGSSGSTGNYQLNITADAPARETNCGDSVDEDRDGLMDCDDFDCELTCTETGAECGAAGSEDGDANANCLDTDCVGFDACIETGAECAGGGDDDGDGMTDCADSDCLTSAACGNTCASNVWDPAVTTTVTGDWATSTHNYRRPLSGPLSSCTSGDTATAVDDAYLFTARVSGLHIFSSAGSAGPDTILYALDGRCGGAALDCDETFHPSMPAFEEIIVDLRAGQTITVVLDNYAAPTGAYMLSVTEPSPMTFGTPVGGGDIVLTEVLFDPVGPESGEWIEIANNTSSPLNLVGCTLEDNSSTHTFTDFVVPAFSFATMAQTATEALSPDYVYGGGIGLNNTGDEITITCAGTVVDRYDFDSSDFAPVEGMSIQLDVGIVFFATDAATENDNDALWCRSSPTPGLSFETFSGRLRSYDGLNLGSPGTANHYCALD